MEMLSPREIRQMVWSVGRFVSEDVTQHLDMPRTVNATARAGGQAVLHYQRAIHAREVWLWVDQATHDLAMDRLVWEVRTSLERAGLPCRSGSFRGIPDPVTWEEGASFTPLSLEGHRQGAVVLVLSHGEDLARTHALAPERPALLVLLHALADWPYLAFVDSSHGQYGLAELLQRYGIRCLAPEDMAAFLGAEAQEARRQVRPSVPFAGDVQAWAAGLALCPDPVEVNQALALHRAMGLRVEPWTLTVLMEQRGTVGVGLEWSPQERADLLNWLVRAEGTVGNVAAQSKLGRALEFWRGYYAIQAEKDPASPAAYRFAIERALLDLWRDPQQAAHDLYGIYITTDNDRMPVFKQEIAQRLGRYVARWHRATEPYLAPDEILLPWVWEEVAPQARALLYRMGFARRFLSAPPLYMPGTLALTLGVFFGVAAALLLQGGEIGWLLLAGLGILTGVRVRQQQRLEEHIAEPLEMVAIPGGTFLMGSAEDDAQAYSEEHPQHRVTVSDFLMARYAVTRQQYREVTGQRPVEWRWDIRGRLTQLWQIVSRQRSLQSLWEEPRSPANYVSWFEAVQFCNVLSAQEDLQSCYLIDGEQVTWDEEADGYRLPTEAEWEYAVRADTTTQWFCGDEATALGDYAWYAENAGGHVQPVGQKEPNPWGLYDMAGNVWEWCWDWDGPYAAEAVHDPSGPATGAFRVLRGGAYWSVARDLRSANRGSFGPENRLDFIGFRVVRRPRRQP
jgi:formylglycine-generating enzyme required for sulfatase activity